MEDNAERSEAEPRNKSKRKERMHVGTLRDVRAKSVPEGARNRKF